ncbi:MAG: hypothetical protein FJW85_09275 [Actinobacteria bacterium]|nr:hypothetical protein [Actinomycetota bacterium]
MRRTLASLAIVCGLILGLVTAPPASADGRFGDPYRPGPPVFDIWCALDPATVIADAVEESVIGDFLWWLVETVTDVEKPPGGLYEPKQIYERGCARGLAYNAERSRRGDMLNQTGDDALLWQNRPHPRVLNSAEEPPDFVVVGMGDSFASGEGNPATPTDWLTELVFPNAWDEVEWTDFTDYPVARSESDDPRLASYCHRSSKSGFANAMLEMRRLYPQFNIYWRNFACSGAESRHLWRDRYVTWKFSQSQSAAGVSSFYSDEEAFLRVAQSRATQETQITQAVRWLGSFHRSKPTVDATYMSVGGNDVFFGPVIAECAFACRSGDEWTDLSQAAIKGGIVAPSAWETVITCEIPLVPLSLCPSTKRIPTAEVVDPLVANCSVMDTAKRGCLSRTPGQRWSSTAQRYGLLNTQIKQFLKPNRVYLAEVPDFTRSDNGQDFCADSHPPLSLAAVYSAALAAHGPDSDAYMVRHDPYVRMDSDWLLSFSEWESWRYAQEKVGSALVSEIRKVATDNGQGATLGWHLVSKGPRGDRLWEGWRDQHGMCALKPFVNNLPEAIDAQGEDMDGPLDVSAGILHPNAFGQQDYAERILFGMIGQLREKMTPKLSPETVTARPNPLGGWTTLGGTDGSQVTITVPWKDLEYPNGNDRPWVIVRTTPITLDIKRVGLRFLQRPDSLTYSLALPRQEEVEFTGADTLTGNKFGATITLSPEDVGALVEIRACGPRAYDGDNRTCGKWQTLGSYTRSPLDVYDPDAYAELRRLERRMSNAAFAQRLKQILGTFAAVKATNIRQGNTNVRVPFGWGKALGPTPLSIAENNAPVVEATTGVDPEWTASQPALSVEPDPDYAIACGVPEDLVWPAIERLMETTRGELTTQGSKLVACLERGEPAVEFPQVPLAGPQILENECEASETELDRIREVMSDDTAPIPGLNDTEPEVFQLLECLHRYGVPYLEKRELAAEPVLEACSLTMLDFPLLASRFSPPMESRAAIECLRQNEGLPPVYWFERGYG